MVRPLSLCHFSASLFLLLSASLAHGQSLFLNCTPVQGAPSRDKDPIALVTVSVQRQEWRVSHLATSGARYERTQQYSLHDISRPGALAWTGTLVDRPYLKMVGLISTNPQGYSYIEHLYDARSDDQEVARTEATCVSVGSGPAPLQLAGRGPYPIEGVGLGDILTQKPLYASLKCSPSEVFRAATWCERSRQERTTNKVYTDTIAFLHSDDGRAYYAARVIEPAFFSGNEINEEIARLSRVYGQQARLLTLPARPGLPAATIAAWGNVRLDPLDDANVRLLASGVSPKNGFIVDFLGDFKRSAQEGLPIYTFSGGPGMIWDANVDDQGKGVLRISALDSTNLALLVGPQIASQNAPQDGSPVAMPVKQFTPSAAPLTPSPAQSQGPAVPMEMMGGTFVVPVQINGQLTLKFTVDSGASDVMIPADVVLTLMRTGTLTSEDFVGNKTYTLADGKTIPSETFRIKSLTVGGRVLEDVLGGVAPVAGGLLLGQSFLTRFRSWSFDNQQQALILN
jgi:predicted aspartyl protease